MSERRAFLLLDEYLINLDAVAYVDFRGFEGGVVINFVGQPATEDADYVFLSQEQAARLREWAEQNEELVVGKIAVPSCV